MLITVRAERVISKPPNHKLTTTNFTPFWKLCPVTSSIYTDILKWFNNVSNLNLIPIYKNLAVPCFFNLLLSVWISDGTHLLVFDILLNLHGYHERSHI